jgi:hypothetical protein
MKLRGQRISRKGWTAAILLGAASIAHPARAQPEWSAAPVCLYSATPPGATLCIHKDSFSRDLCQAIGYFASANDLPPDFFARLLWRESSFRPEAISPKGARGIAQFMPGTARLRGLDDSHDALKAMGKAAEYLDVLRDRFGNLGLAAAAYNAGENGLSSYLVSGGLPAETRGYVLAITGHTVEEWRDEPPDAAAPALDPEKPFLDSCIALADRGPKPSPEREGVWAPWGAQLAAHFKSTVARNLFLKVASTLPPPLNAEEPLILRDRNPDFGFRPRYAARIARQSREEANAVCLAVHKAGGTCLVFKN